jgi:hypothetical protein
VGIIISIFISAVVIKLKLYSHQSEFLFLQFGFYNILSKKIFLCFGENIYLAFQFLLPRNNIDPIIDFLYIDDNNIFKNNLVCNILNMNFGIINCIIKNQCFFIHSMNELFFSPNQLYFLSVEVQRIHDDSLI